MVLPWGAGSKAGCSLKITYVSSEFEPASTAVAVRSAFHVRKLASHGHNVTVITATANADASPTPEGVRILSTKIRPPDNKQGILRRLANETCFAISVRREIRRISKADVIVITSPPFFMTIMLAALLGSRSPMLVVDVRDRYPAVLFSLGMLPPDSLPGRLLRRAERWLYRKAQTVCTVTDELVTRIESETGVTPQKVMNGYIHAIDRTQFEMRPARPFHVVMHGNFSRFFDESVFGELLEMLERSGLAFEVTVAGSGSKMHILQRLDHAFVSIRENLDQSEVLGLLTSADMGLSVHSNTPSMITAFPVKVFEFIGAEIPSVVIPVNAAGEFVQKHGLGRAFNEDAVDEAADFIAQLAADREAYNRYVANIRRIKPGLSREAQAEVFAQSVDRLAEKEIM